MAMILPPGFEYCLGRLRVKTASGGWRFATKYERGRIADMHKAHEAGDTEAFRIAHSRAVAKLNYRLDAGR